MSLFSSLIPGLDSITSIVGLLGAGGQARQGNSLSNRGQGYQDQAVKNAQNSYQQALKIYQDRLQGGGYNSAAMMKLLGDQSNADLTKTDKNTAAQLSTLNYKRGDSPFQQSAQHNSEAAGFKLRSDLMNAQNFYDNKQNSDLGMVQGANQYLGNVLTGIGGQEIQRGNQMSQCAYNTFGQLLSGGLFKGQGGRVGTPPFNPDPRQNPTSPYMWDNNANHQYDQNGNLIS